jgi:type II secretory pathway pseudopilin PulG
MRNYKKHTTGGFTLLETLISIGVVGVIGILITQVFFVTTRTNTKTELLKDVKQNGDYVIGIMSRMIRNATRIESTCADSGTSSTTFSFTNPDGNITTLGCAYDNDSQVTRVASTSATTNIPDYITSRNVTLGGTSCSDPTMTLVFTCTSLPGQAPKVSINLKMSQRGTPADQFDRASVSFQTTVSPRF